MTRVVADAENGTDRFKGLTRIGIDEISYKRGHKYLTVIVDHTSGVLQAGPRPGLRHSRHRVHAPTNSPFAISILRRGPALGRLSFDSRGDRQPSAVAS